MAPTLTIVPSAGELTWLVEFLSPDYLEPTTYSILGVIVKLFSTGDRFLGVVLVLFSVLFPVGKLALYWIAAGCGPDLGRASGLLKWAHRAGKFSMAEVFAMALIVVVVKTLPGGSTAEVQWGAYVFVASVLSTILVSFGLDRACEPNES
tara:strand:+ start:1203 stop:1652 length:450 start_codon:yes stop_codon:yes gene_type:complete